MPENTMINQDDLLKVQAKVQELEQTAREIMDRSQGVPAIERNTQRILASIAMLKITLGSSDF